MEKEKEKEKKKFSVDMYLDITYLNGPNQLINKNLGMF